MHARMKNEFTEDEKSHNLMPWLKSLLLLTGYKNGFVMPFKVFG